MVVSVLAASPSASMTTSFGTPIAVATSVAVAVRPRPAVRVSRTATVSLMRLRMPREAQSIERISSAKAPRMRRRA